MVIIQCWLYFLCAFASLSAMEKKISLKQLKPAVSSFTIKLKKYESVFNDKKITKYEQYPLNEYQLKTFPQKSPVIANAIAKHKTELDLTQLDIPPLHFSQFIASTPEKQPSKLNSMELISYLKIINALKLAALESIIFHTALSKISHFQHEDLLNLMIIGAKSQDPDLKNNYIERITTEFASRLVSESFLDNFKNNRQALSDLKFSKLYEHDLAKNIIEKTDLKKQLFKYIDPIAKELICPTPVTEFVFDPNSKLIVLGTQDGALHIFSTDGTLNKILKSNSEISILDFNPFKHHNLISGHSDGTVTLWKIEMDQPVSIRKVHTKKITALCFDQTGDDFFTGDEEGLIIHWNEKNNTPLKSLKDQRFQPVLALVYNNKTGKLCAGNYEHISVITLAESEYHQARNKADKTLERLQKKMFKIIFDLSDQEYDECIFPACNQPKINQKIIVNPNKNIPEHLKLSSQNQFLLIPEKDNIFPAVELRQKIDLEKTMYSPDGKYVACKERTTPNQIDLRDPAALNKLNETSNNLSKIIFLVYCLKFPETNFQNIPHLQPYASHFKPIIDKIIETKKIKIDNNNESKEEVI